MGNFLPLAIRRLLPPPPHYRGTDSNTLREEFKHAPRKRNSQISSITDSLPDELLFDILLLLPADFLYEKARFVCRKWSQIIRSEGFINAQIRQSSVGLLLLSDKHCHPIYVTAEPGGIRVRELTSSKFGTNIFNSCNGLVVEIHSYNRKSPSLRIINPATNQQFHLPPVPIIGDREFYDNECSIAYSAASKKYKVTLPYFVIHDNDLAYCGGLFIFTTGVDESWRNVPIHHLSDEVTSLLVMARALSTEGFLHWVGWGEVLTLNVETETFTYSEIPDREYIGLSTGRNLSVLSRREELVWEIWEMRPENGEWRNLMPLEVNLRPLRQWVHQELGYGHHERLWLLGWVKYPEVLAFCFGKESHTCIFYFLDTHGIGIVELPATNESYRASPHRNNLVRLNS